MKTNGVKFESYESKGTHETSVKWELPVRPHPPKIKMGRCPYFYLNPFFLQHALAAVRQSE